MPLKSIENGRLYLQTPPDKYTERKTYEEAQP